ncbi:MAG: hypothetical protein R3316_11795, partial [Rhodovibrionaceae bacterium]|nr:hypothetical protein [Rhodovibrionaceae bacterium]
MALGAWHRRNGIMDPKVASLVVQEVGKALQDKDRSLASQEPAETRIARFADSLIAAQRDHKFTKEMRALGSDRDMGAPILTPDEVVALKQALSAIEIASMGSADEGNKITGFIKGLLGETEPQKDAAAYEALVTTLQEYAADDLVPGVAAPAGDSFETEDGRYIVTVGEDGRVSFRDT